MCSAGLNWIFLSSLLGSLNLRPGKEHEKLLSQTCAALSLSPVSADSIKLHIATASCRTYISCFLLEGCEWAICYWRATEREHLIYECDIGDSGGLGGKSLRRPWQPRKPVSTKWSAEFLILGGSGNTDPRAPN